MVMRLNPYLSFRDTAREAMEFYQSVFGGQLDLSTFGEFQMTDDPAEKDGIMHSMLTTDDGFVLMGADTPSSMPHDPNGNHSVSLSGDDEPTLSGFFEKLSDGGSVTVPLEKAPWGDSFGMLTDRFGVPWLVNISGSPRG